MQLKTKYEQLFEGFGEASKQHRAQRKACYTFAKSVLSGFQEFLGCPAKAFLLLNAQAELSETDYGFLEEVVMEKAPDGYWKFQFRFHLQRSEHALALAWLTFEFLVRQTDSGFTLRWGLNQYSLASNVNECEEFPAFCDAFFECLTSYLTLPMSWFPSDTSMERRAGPIGYSLAPLELPEKSQP